MLKKSKLPSYSDGVMTVYREKDERTSFGARINPASLDEMDVVASVRYADAGIRERDFDFANQMGFTLSAKVRCPRFVGIDSDCKVLLGGALYGISYIDRSARELYLYLEGGEPIEQHA